MGAALRRPRPDGGRRRRRLALAHGGGHRRPGDRGLGDRGHRGDDRQLPADGGALAGDVAPGGRLRLGAQPGGRLQRRPISIRRWRAGRRRCRAWRGRAHLRRVELPSPAGPVRLVALGTDRREPRPHLRAQGRASPDEAWPAFQDGGAVVVSEPFAHRTGIGAARRVRLRTARGDRAFRVAGVYYDYASDQGLVLMSRRTYLRTGTIRPSPASRWTWRPGPTRTRSIERLRAGGRRARDPGDPVQPRRSRRSRWRSSTAPS